jgi:hypothetical protein
MSRRQQRKCLQAALLQDPVNKCNGTYAMEEHGGVKVELHACLTLTQIEVSFQFPAAAT